MSPLPIYASKNGSLLLDRDGVINVRLVDEYVRQWADFVFVPGTKEAINKLRNIFKFILVFTNQQGVAKGLMTLQDLESIHSQMLRELKGQIDRVYACVHLSEDQCSCRKPKTKMLELAKHDFPQIDYKNSIMVGDSLSDMTFGKRVGATTVMVSSDDSLRDKEGSPEIDFVVGSLAEFADRLVIQ